MNIEEIDIILRNAAVILEGLAAFIAILFYRKYKHTSLRFFSLILVYVFLNEVTAGMIHRYLGSKINLLYTIYNIIFFLFFYYVFWNFVKKPNFRKLIKIAAIVYILACIINPFYQDFIIRPQLFAYVVGACLLIFCIILYYIEILSTSRILLINQELLFWISIGLLLFYVGYLPIKLTRHYSATDANEFVTLIVVQLILTIIMNGCFIFGFLWTKKK